MSLTNILEKVEKIEHSEWEYRYQGGPGVARKIYLSDEPILKEVFKKVGQGAFGPRIYGESEFLDKLVY